jgi:prevent-host-death family protein
VVVRRLSAEETQQSLPDLLDLVCNGEEPIIVERDGEPVAVLISPQQYDRYVAYLTERFRKVVDELHALNADKVPDEIMRDVTEIVEEVRQERYERKQRGP